VKGGEKHEEIEKIEKKREKVLKGGEKG